MNRFLVMKIKRRTIIKDLNNRPYCNEIIRGILRQTFNTELVASPMQPSLPIPVTIYLTTDHHGKKIVEQSIQLWSINEIS